MTGISALVAEAAICTTQSSHRSTGINENENEDLCLEVSEEDVEDDGVFGGEGGGEGAARKAQHVQQPALH